MERSLLCSNLFSHPNKPLEEHLIKTAILAEIFAKESSLGAGFQRFLKIVALTHDLGKATEYFQEYLAVLEDKKTSLRQKPETRHGLLSAVCSYFLSNEVFEDELLPILAFVIVRRHHLDLIDLMDEIVNEKEIDLLIRQIESIKEEKFNILCEHLYKSGLPIKLEKEKLFIWAKSIVKEIRTYRRRLRKKLSFDTYFLLNLFYSILLDADKSEVVINEIDLFKRKRPAIRLSVVEAWKAKQKFVPNYINSLREEAYNEALYNALNETKRIYSLNLPTGMGKTITSLSLAIKLREKIINDSKGAIIPRIIYTLPFLSIIDQNGSLFEEILRTEYTVDSALLLKHHHLSEIYYKTEEQEFESDEAKIMTEGWNAEIVVTTFVQLFHTLISNKNRALRKFHRVVNSIIVLDEIQAIPVKYWGLTEKLFEELAEKYNIRLILSTATTPLIFGQQSLYSLVDKEKYFKKLDRTILIPKLTKITIEDFVKDFVIDRNKHYLLVLNTIKSAKYLYTLLKEKLSENITFLSTGLVPYERLQRIRAIRKGQYNMVVSTQLVEAGVDIDFDIVVRDMAPLDCINQVAGRCNRNFLKDKGVVTIISLVDENGREYASYIYDPVLLNTTREILKDFEEVQEDRFLSLIERYYSELSIKKVQYESEQLLEAVKRLRYASTDGEQISIIDFKLIEDSVPKEDVFVEINEEAKTVWRCFGKLRDIKDRFERKNKFDEIKAKFYQFVISVPVMHINKNPPPLVNGIRYVSSSQLEEHYDKETGFRSDLNGTYIW